MCEQNFPVSSFYSYGYVTRQGKQSTRYESRCKDCSIRRNRERTLSNPGLNSQVARKWRARNPDAAKAYQASYRASASGRIIKAKAQRLRKARTRSGQINSPEIKAVYTEAMRIEQVIQCCPVFDLPELGKKIHVDHIVPLARGGAHEVGNLQLLPIGLNMRKGVKCPL